MESSPPTVTVHVKFGGRTIPVEVPAAASAAELKRLLQPLTNVLPRGQRLICKGKVLADAASLSSMQVGDGSKVMLIASQGLHQGDGPITKSSSGPASSARRTSNSQMLGKVKYKNLRLSAKADRSVGKQLVLLLCRIPA